MDGKQSNANNINSINRAFTILGLFHDTWELGIQDISRLTGLNKTTVFRVVKSLEANRMLVQNHCTNKYCPGFAILELAHNVYHKYDVKYIFEPFMRRLQEEFNEDVILSILSDIHAVCIERFEGDNAINLHSRVGLSLPVYSGSTARVLLSNLDSGSLERVYQELQLGQTLAKPTTRAELEESMEFVRQNGYLASCGVMDEGVYSVSIPVKMDDTHIYSLGICGVEERMYNKDVKRITERLLDYGRQITEKLAYCDVIQK